MIGQIHYTLFLQDFASNHPNLFEMMVGYSLQEHLKPQITLQLAPDLLEIHGILKLRFMNSALLKKAAHKSNEV